MGSQLDHRSGEEIPVTTVSKLGKRGRERGRSETLPVIPRRSLTVGGCQTLQEDPLLILRTITAAPNTLESPAMRLQ